jgi:hypothetical protein
VVDAWSITDEFGDGENLLLTAQLPSGEVFMAGLLVQYTEGAAATDGFVGPGVARDLVVHTMRETNEDVDAARIEFADARARVEDAIVAGERMLPPFETETWPGCRSAIEWLLRSMPPDGKGYDWHEWTESERDALAMAFLESPWGQTFRDDDVARALVDAMLWFGCGYAPADPFRWSPQKIAIFFEDWVPRKLMIPADEIARLPSVVRRFVQYVHARSEIPERLTTVTLNAIEECTGEGFTSDDVHTSFVAWQTDQFALEVGGHDVLERLDTKPLPDEPFDWSSVPGDLQARVTTLLELIDGACAEFFDVECRTAARRLLARVVAGNPDVLRRRARDEITAACVVWLVGRGNDRFDQRVQVKEMLAWFGIPNAALSQRGRVIADAAGVPLAEYGYPLGDVALLDSGHRAWILERQERIAKMEW